MARNGSIRRPVMELRISGMGDGEHPFEFETTAEEINKAVVAAANGPHGPDHFIVFGAFENIASGPGPHGGKNRAIVIKHSHNQDPNMGAGVDDPAGGLNPV